MSSRHHTPQSYRDQMGPEFQLRIGVRQNLGIRIGVRHAILRFSYSSNAFKTGPLSLLARFLRAICSSLTTAAKMLA